MAQWSIVTILVTSHAVVLEKKSKMSQQNSRDKVAILEYEML
jgi:hypothetical protein